MIDLLVLDVDGCMTDGDIIYTTKGDELKHFNVKDGFAIVQWRRLGKKVAIITGRDSGVVERRAKELCVDYLVQGVKRKEEALRKIAQSCSVKMENIAAIGDDLNDFRLLKSVGISFAPADGVEYIKRSVDVVLTKGGGKGAVREMIEYLLEKEGLMEEYRNFWTGV